MKITEAFLVDTKLFDSVIEELVNLEEPVPAINSALLEELGYVDLNARLLVKILKELGIITMDGGPGELFDEFSNPDTTKKALAKGLVNAYESFFEDNPSIHHKDSKEVNKQFTKIFGEEKTALIIKYMSETFVKISSYCGKSVIDDVLKELSPKEAVSHSEINGQASDYSEKNTNGSHSNESENDNYNGVFEEIRAQNFDDIVTKFDGSRSKGSENDYFDDEIFNDDDKINDDIIEKKDENVTDDPFNLDNATDRQGDDNNKSAAEVNSAKDDKAPGIVEKSGINDENILSEFTTSEFSDKDSELIQKAFFRRAELCYKLERWEDLLPALNQLINKYEDSDNKRVAEVVSRSVIRRAKALFKLKQFDKALPALDAIIKRLKDSEIKEFYHQASLAMLYKVELLENSETKSDNEQLLPLYNGIIDRLDDHSDPSIREKVDAIHFKQFDIVIEKGDKQEILKYSTQLVNRFRNEAKNPEYLKLAMIKRAEILEEMNRNEEALEAYEEFLTMFG